MRRAATCVLEGKRACSCWKRGAGRAGLAKQHLWDDFPLLARTVSVTAQELRGDSTTPLGGRTRGYLVLMTHLSYP